MKIGVPKEIHAGETRAALVPAHVGKLVKMGGEVEIEPGLGQLAGFSDAAYTAVGATVAASRDALLASAEVVLRLRKPPLAEVGRLRKGCIHISFLDPFNEKELIQALAAQGVSAISMEMIPRTTRAQKMDALTSQANLAGYMAVILAAAHSPRILPMMVTVAGTIVAARVFIIGAGVAGLQAIATARRLGARVDAFDTRPVVAEQVQSLGAKFVKIDLGETGQTKDGYAKALTPEQLAKQREGMKKFCGESDVVITTAQVFGRNAPLIVTADMVSAMKPGSVIVDLAAESGGNVAGTVCDQVSDHAGVKIIGFTHLASRVPTHASQMYSANLLAWLEEFWNKETKSLRLKLDDDIIQGCLITHQGALWNEKLKSAAAS